MIEDLKEFINDVNKDSVLSFTIIQKILCYLLITGHSDEEVSKILKIKYNSAKTARMAMINRVNSARALVAFADKYNLNTSKRPYIHHYKANNIAYIDEETGYIIDYLSGKAVHSAKDPKYHASVIILPYKYDGSEPLFPIALKDRGYYENFDVENLDCRLLCDAVGVHVRMTDVGEETMITDEVYVRAAMRALREELYSPKKKDIERSLLKLLSIDDFKGPLETGGFNSERSALYVYRLPDETARDVRYYTTYNDTLNVKLHFRLASKWVTFHQLLDIVAGKDKKFLAMNGLKRVVGALSENPGVLMKTPL